MPYTTPENVRDVLRGSAEDGDGGTAAELQDEQIELEIINAQAQIDSILFKTYKVPFSPVPVLVVSLATDIAAYLCDLNYRKSREYESDNYPIIRRYNRARELLEWLRTGVATLPIKREPTEINVAEVVHQYEGRLFTEEEVFGPFEREW